MLVALATVCVGAWSRMRDPGGTGGGRAAELIESDVERASRSWDQAHKDMAEYEQRWHLSRYTEEDDPTKWEDGTPPVFLLAIHLRHSIILFLKLLTGVFARRGRLRLTTPNSDS